MNEFFHNLIMFLPLFIIILYFPILFLMFINMYRLYKDFITEKQKTMYDAVCTTLFIFITVMFFIFQYIKNEHVETLKLKYQYEQKHNEFLKK